MHYTLVPPPSHCYASAGWMRAAKASAEPIMRMPQT